MIENKCPKNCKHCSNEHRWDEWNSSDLEFIKDIKSWECKVSRTFYDPNTRVCTGCGAHWIKWENSEVWITCESDQLINSHGEWSCKSGMFYNKYTK